MAFENALQSVDSALYNVLSQWNAYTTSIAGLIVAFAAYRLFTSSDPDTHPMLLARQAQASLVRYPGESAVYRSHAAPRGMELNSGLNIRDAQTSRWGRGRDGDLRDVWRRFVNGPTDDNGNATSGWGKLISLLGSETTTTYDPARVSAQIAIIGQYLEQNQGSRIAIYLPNSIEFLVALFACAFYNLTPILIPYDQSSETVAGMLKEAKADSLIAPVGMLSFDTVTTAYTGLKHLIWVIDEGSKHLDWNEVPKGTGGAVNVGTWQEILDDGKYNATPSVETSLPTTTLGSVPKSVVAFWQKTPDVVGQMVEYTHANLVAAISAQLSAIPTTHKITTKDVFLPADSLSTVYTLVVTLAAMFYNATIVLHSVAGPKADLVAASSGVAPTIVVASSKALVKLHQESKSKLGSSLSQLIHWLQTRSLTQDGRMPASSLLTRFNDSLRPTIGLQPGRLRLIFTSERAAGAESAVLSSKALSDLRVFTGARVIYALTGAGVAGAISQTNFFDYRVAEDLGGKQSHFGVPVTSVEIFLRDTPTAKNVGQTVAGEIIARGPAVVGEETALGVTGTIRIDNTLAYYS